VIGARAVFLLQEWIRVCVEDFRLRNSEFEAGEPMPSPAECSMNVRRAADVRGVSMARIAKSEYPKIQEMASAGGRKVAEIAGLYGCTPANIYAILAKLRREGDDGAVAPVAVPDRATAPGHPAGGAATPEGLPCPGAEGAMPRDLFASIERDKVRPTQPEAIGEPSEPKEEPAPEGKAAIIQHAEAKVAAQPIEATPRAVSLETRPVAAAPPAQAGVGTRGGATPSAAGSRPARAAKPEFALRMRTSDGDESSTPFRSLDDLLSAARPILRSAARSPDPIWFSIQPVDLADMDGEAA
jgi:hypothetical protein